MADRPFPSETDVPERPGIIGVDSFVGLGGWQAHLVRWRGASSNPVLLLHGFTAHAQSWRHLAGVLAPRCDVLALDQRGHGLSAPTSEVGTRVMVRDVGMLLDALGIDRVSLVGQSMGGITAFLFAASLPERVDRLVVVDIGPEIAPEGAARIAAGANRPDVFVGFEEAMAEARRSFPLADPQLLAERVRHNLVAVGDSRWTWRTDRDLRTGTAIRDDHTIEERWAAWASSGVPTLLVRGSESDILTPPLAQRMLDARPATSYVEIEGASHSVPLDRPEALASVVESFLRGPEAAATPKS